MHPSFARSAEYALYYEQAKSGTFTLQPRPAPAPADKRRRVSSPDYEQVAKQWAAMKVLLESLGCYILAPEPGSPGGTAAK